VAPERIDLPQGTLDLLVLRPLALGPHHGWAVSERVQQMSSDVLRIQQGSLYPALHRLERKGWIQARWGASENNRRAKFYELTKSGQHQLEAEKDARQKLTAVVAQVLVVRSATDRLVEALTAPLEGGGSSPQRTTPPSA
jgi:PadR family transcriptional regulator PadR